jgi:hypothetical protein
MCQEAARPALWINNRGQIVGFYSDGTMHGFLLDRVAFTPINVPGAVLKTEGQGINDRGEIVGFYSDGTGDGFVWF